MDRRRIFGLFFGLVLLALLVVGGIYLYQIGVAQGIAQAQAAPEGAQGLRGPLGGYGYYPMFRPRFFFPPFGLFCLVGLAFWFLVLGGPFFFFRMRGWRGGGYPPYGPYGHHHMHEHPEEQPRTSDQPPASDQ